MKRLWYAKEANIWNEALPLGNGRLGAMVFGDPYSEKITINEDTLWAGSPDTQKRHHSMEEVREIRQLVAEGTLEEISEKYITVNSLELRVRGDVNRIRMTLNDIEEISFYEIAEDGEYKKIHIEYKKNCDIKERLFFEFSALEYPIVSMVNTTMSLEDVFLKLTAEQIASEETKPEILTEPDGDNDEEDAEEEYTPLFGKDTEDEE